MASVVDRRGSVGPKRSRNDASRGDGDWTCPHCGNVNFSFRNICNRGSCGAPRPRTSTGMEPAPFPGSYGHAPHYFDGPRATQPIPLGLSGGYSAPFPSPGMQYDYQPSTNIPPLYGPPTNAPPYGFLPAYGYPGPMGGRNYGPAPGMNDYGFGLRGFPSQVPGPWAARSLPDNASRKRRGGPDGLAEGDWVCPKCGNVNFAFRTICNINECGTLRPNPPASSNNAASGMMEGSWTCSKCGNLNYPFRTVCNRRGCGNEKPPVSAQ